jgi:uncharacterized membrane protein YkvA (DUF1232 family)
LTNPNLKDRWVRLKQWAKQLKVQVLTVYVLGRDPRMPWSLRLLALGVAAYALSPIDLIPDFIPILGYLDDLLLVPFGLWLVLYWTPSLLKHDAALQAQVLAQRPVSWVAALIMILIWLIMIIAVLQHYGWLRLDRLRLHP